MSGRKIKREYENPIDNLIIDTTGALNPIFYKLHFTPNILTTISLIIGLLSSLLIYKKYYISGGILFFISYMFDCYDGNFARKYNMASDFGDLYDHIGDLIKFSAFIYVFLKIKHISLKKIKRIILILIILGVLMLWHLGCQELNYKINKNSNKSVLNKFEVLCYKKEHIKYSRYFGCGTFAFFISIYIIFIRVL